ncbi:MAG: hypothetical protein ACTHKC_05270 [Candidatus Nitrosocosmicus sp.]
MPHKQLGIFAFHSSSPVRSLGVFAFTELAAGSNITVVPNSLDFSDILKFGTLGAEVVCGGIVHNGSIDLASTFKSGPSCVAGALGAAPVKLTTLS